MIFGVQTMQKALCFLILALAVALSFLPQQASALGLEASAGLWWQNPSGDVQVDGGDSLDLESDLGYDTVLRPFGRLKLDLPGFFPNIYFMATPLEVDEKTTSDFTFTFNGEDFSGNVPFRSKLKLDHYDIALFYTIPLLKPGTFGLLNVDLGLNVRLIDFKVKIDQDDTDTAVSESFLFALPMLYAGVQFQPLERLGLEVEARGILFRSNYYIDLIPRIKVKVVSPLFIAGGYRYEQVQIDYQEVEATVTFQGPFVEAGVSW
jgi:outer membrane protein